MRFLVCSTVICLILTPAFIFAQPGAAWIHAYDAGRGNHFQDIYAVEGGGYIMCGAAYEDGRRNDNTADFYICRIDDEGEELWSGTYGHPDAYDWAHSIIETDNGDFVAVGTGNDRIAALKVDAEGEEVWFETYASLRGKAVIELKNDDILIAGYDYYNGILICIDTDGEVQWSEDYESGQFWGMRETNGGVVVSGWEWFNDFPYHNVWVIKVDPDEEGEIIWSRFHAPYNAQTCESIVSDGNGGFVLPIMTWTGNGGNDFKYASFFVNNDGILSSNHVYDFDLLDCYPKCIERVAHGYVIVGYTCEGGLPLALRINEAGGERWHDTYDLSAYEGFSRATNGFYSVVEDNNGDIVLAGSKSNRDQENIRDGFVMKFLSDPLEPQFIYWEPEDTMLTVLLEDTVTFLVRAFDAQGDEMRYSWTMDDELVPNNDTTATIIFNQLGMHDVKCEVTDAEFTVDITWHVDVKEWYIFSHTPDSLDIEVLRGDAIDFSLFVRTIEDLELDYQWFHADAEDRYDEGNEDSARVIFDISGEHQVDGIVSRGEEFQRITWNVNTVGFKIRGYDPDTLSLTVRRKSEVEFELEVEEVDDVEVEYQWTMSGRETHHDLGSEQTATALFDQAGDFRVEGYVRFEGQSESVLWAVDVYSCIWSWYPQELNMTVPEDTSMFFHLEAYNPHSDSLSYHWFQNGERIHVDTTIAELFLDFHETGDNLILGIIHDGMDIDTIRWNIDVYDPWSVSDDPYSIPEEISLSSPCPNPFNSSATINFSLPEAGNISLRIFDLGGRCVSSPANGRFSAGSHSINFDASDLSTGLYIIRLETSFILNTEREKSITTKAVVIK